MADSSPLEERLDTVIARAEEAMERIEALEAEAAEVQGQLLAGRRASALVGVQLQALIGQLNLNIFSQNQQVAQKAQTCIRYLREASAGVTARIETSETPETLATEWRTRVVEYCSSRGFPDVM